jgi:hypothetical protein
LASASDEQGPIERALHRKTPSGRLGVILPVNLTLLDSHTLLITVPRSTLE